ncbi:MAG: hypothetical protein GY822_10065 [Deltaproteobacteria bacterium]|nr:hypothetical protein [Deltaproteobacteria bacterium]
MLDGDASEVRTFRAPNPKAALQAVKLAFGDDAIILSSREVAGGLFKPKEIEVVARRGQPLEESLDPALTEQGKSEASRVLHFHAAQRRANEQRTAASNRPAALPKTRRAPLESRASLPAFATPQEVAELDNRAAPASTTSNTKTKRAPREESFEERYERERNLRQSPMQMSVEDSQHAQHQAQQDQAQQDQAQQDQAQQNQAQQHQAQQHQAQQHQAQQHQAQQHQAQQVSQEEAQFYAQQEPMAAARPLQYAQPAFTAVQQAVTARLETEAPYASQGLQQTTQSLSSQMMQHAMPQMHGAQMHAQTHNPQMQQEVAQRTFLLTQLIDRGLDEKLATGLVDDAFRQMGGRVDPIGRLRRTVRGMISISRAPWSPDPTGDRSVIALVGPTGVGKTTTVAKIAARARMEFGLKVCMVTIDTYRIGAIDQLARYGELMGVPTYVARDQSSFGDALEHTKDADLVLVDTAGRSPTDKDAIAQQAALLRSWSELQMHLAVPASTSSRQLSVILDRYQTMDPERILITKVDEAVGPGSVFNIASRADAPISCITDGQRVPEDLHAPSMSTIVDWVVPK